MCHAGVMVSKHIATVMRTPEGMPSPNPAALLKRLFNKLREDLGDAYTGPVFVHWRHGRFQNMPIGKNTIAKYPQKHAAALSLDSPNLYTGHAYRRSAACAMVEAGANAR